jgi:tRNA-2-methylthio-N6-dimethylallyladenosine synthase
VVEVTLIGQNITSYGKNLSPSAPQFPLIEARPERRPERWETNLAGLLRAVAAVPGIRRVRFLTGHPAFVDDGLFAALRECPTICPWLHVPAQSGSDRILKRMKRGYTRSEYLELVARGRERVPGLAFTSDFIVGFPGETEEDFQATVDLMERVRFQGSFVFKYSPRPDTPAVRLADDVPGRIKRERNQVLLRLQERHSAEAAARWVGREVEVLFEGPSKTNPRRQAGRTRWNQIAVVEESRDLAGRFALVRVTRATALTLFGELVGEPGPTPRAEAAHAR